MIFEYAADTDIGNTKSTNQDSFAVRKLSTPCGDMVFAVLCDGMGGLDCGEVASGSVIYAFDNWMRVQLPAICRSGLSDSVIREQWTDLASLMNMRIKEYGAGRHITLGTTLVAMLLTQTRYYIINIGDSRAYEIGDSVVQLTHDHSYVAREVAEGRLTEEEARVHPRRNVLLQCVGASERVYPEMVFGDIKDNSCFMLCSDGFRHEISDVEMHSALCFNASADEETMQNNIRQLINLNMQRNESDNISVVLVKAINGGSR